MILKRKSQYITYEYRDTHKSYFLGFNGNKGSKFIDYHNQLLFWKTNNKYFV